MLVKNEIEKLCYELKIKLIYLRVNYFFFFLKVYDMEFVFSLDIIINEIFLVL